jgi:phosphatidylinositol-3,4,5-trisphosphate 3-phosphatase/dual-specificity protein phosphatase PTEN
MAHLLADPRNVCVVHCNHGKGRTGTLICCFLLFTGYFASARDAMDFYGAERFEKEGYGVTQPCQIKYIEYFNEILHRPPMLPLVLTLHKVIIRGGYHLREPYFKLHNIEHNDYFFNTKDSHMEAL